MLVCHSPKFAFVHVPKTGGSSITAALGPLAHPSRSYEDESPGWQIPFHNVGGMHTGYEHFDGREGYFVFGFVRNPYDRMVSYYHALRKEGERKALRLVDNIAQEFDFPEFTRFVEAFPKALPPHILRTQYDQLFPEKGGGVDFVGRYENLAGDFQYILRTLGLDSMRLPFYNTSDHRRYTDYYTPAAREVMEDLFGKDLEEFGYEYGN